MAKSQDSPRPGWVHVEPGDYGIVVVGSGAFVGWVGFYESDEHPGLAVVDCIHEQIILRRTSIFRPAQGVSSLEIYRALRFDRWGGDEPKEVESDPA